MIDPGGLVALAFKVIFGNDDVLLVVLCITLFFGLALSILEIYRRVRG